MKVSAIAKKLNVAEVTVRVLIARSERKIAQAGDAKRFVEWVHLVELETAARSARRECETLHHLWNEAAHVLSLARRAALGPCVLGEVEGIVKKFEAEYKRAVANSVHIPCGSFECCPKKWPLRREKHGNN
jgi:hypothetical protein